MNQVLPETLNQLKKDYQYRDYEFDCLDALIQPEFEDSVPVINIFGYKSVGKTLIVSEFLRKMNFSHSVITCDEYLSQKILLSNVLLRIMEDIGVEVSENLSFLNKGTYVTSVFSTCDNIFSFASNLEEYLKAAQFEGHHVVVLDRIDQFPDDPHEVIAGLARLHEVSFSRVTFVLIGNIEEPIEAVTSSMSQIYFRPYTQDEIIHIFKKHRFCFFGSPEVDETPAAQGFWDKYVQVMVESCFPFTGSAMNLLADFCFSKWDAFIEPILDARFTLDDFMKIYNSNKDMFGNDEALQTSLVKDYTTLEVEEDGSIMKLSDLTYQAKFLLIAGYLGSYIEPKNDLHYFSAVKKKQNNQKRKFKKKRQKSQTLLKKDIDIKLLSPNGFDLERLFAIFLVIYRSEAKYFNDDEEFAQLFKELSDLELVEREHEIAKLSLASNIDLAAQVALLETQGHISRTATKDILHAKLRWRCVLSFEEIQIVANDVDFPLETYLGD